MHLTASIETCRDRPRKQLGIVVLVEFVFDDAALRDSFSEDRASDALCQCHHGAVLKVQWPRISRWIFLFQSWTSH